MPRTRGISSIIHQRCVCPALTSRQWDLRDELIQDKLVVGIRNRRLSKWLQLDADLTLDRAVTIIRKSETVHQQHVFLRRDNDETKQFPIIVVKTSKGPDKSMSNTCSGSVPSKNNMCSRCRNNPNHDIRMCPAKDAICSIHVYGKNRHFQRVCRSKKISSVKEIPKQSDESFFLGVVWTQKTEP